MEWIDVNKQKPRSQKRVLAFSSRRAVMAQYIAPKTVLSEDFLSDDYDISDYKEYDGGNDCYWVIEGWWEISEEANLNCNISGEVTHWMPLPTSPK